jgi:hypothetical protein
MAHTLAASPVPRQESGKLSIRLPANCSWSLGKHIFMFDFVRCHAQKYDSISFMGSILIINSQQEADAKFHHWLVELTVLNDMFV